jgi:outer membrane murein-binding lipoprotein Lpp
MEFIFTWRELLVAVILATLVYLLEVGLLSRRRKGGVRQDGSVAELLAQVARLEREVESLRGRLQAIETRNAPYPPQPPVEETPYARAVRLAREGLPAQELVARCGISHGEAELIVALNRVRDEGRGG